MFIDSSEASLEVLLLYDGNKLSSVSLAHAANIKEFYENMKLLLEKIQCEKCNWNLCGDLKSLHSCLACSYAAQNFVVFYDRMTVHRNRFLVN